MSTEHVERRLTAILAADIAGYSRLMGNDEEGTLAQLKALRHALVDRKINEHHGRIVKTTGDGMLVEFASVVEAVRCAVEIQRGMAERNVAAPAGQRIEFRVGINVGDIIIEGDDIFGDGVNVAARLEGLAETAGASFSRILLAAAYAQDDRAEDAARVVTMIRRIDPTFDPQEFGNKFLSYPVAYFTTGSPTRGLPEIEYEWDEHRYLFANAEHRELFKADPVRYAPQFGNYCAMALAEGGLTEANPENWLISDGKLYIFGKPAPMGPTLFQQDLAANIAKANENRALIQSH